MIIIEKNPLNEFINYFFSINPYELGIVANILGTLLAIPLTFNQQNTLGNFLELVGQQILLIQAQNTLLSPMTINQLNLNQILKELNFKFEYLEDLIIYLKGEFDRNN